jgi:peptide methionine sulfoxide reductase msrA/msrB
MTSAAKTETAIFAAGCFWGVQYYYDKVPGVIKTEVGYTGGHTENPSYWQVASRRSGHAEALKITFKPAEVSYETLLKHFFRIQDPTSKYVPDGINGGDEYRTEIFYTTPAQKQTAEAMINKLNNEKYKGKIATSVTAAGKFYPAESEHQKFTEKTGIGACHIDYSPV